MSRYLGIDYGTKRIGLALGDDSSHIASPIQTVAARGQVTQHVEAVLVVAREYDLDVFVVGLPLNMDGTEGSQAKITRRFGDELQRQSGIRVTYFDERLSSHTAQELMRPAGLTHKRKRAIEDAVAAQVILQGFLDGLADHPDER